MKTTKYKLCLVGPKKHAITRNKELHIFVHNHGSHQIFTCEDHAGLVDSKEYSLTYAAKVL